MYSLLENACVRVIISTSWWEWYHCSYHILSLKTYYIKVRYIVWCWDQTMKQAKVKHLILDHFVSKITWLDRNVIWYIHSLCIFNIFLIEGRCFVSNRTYHTGHFRMDLTVNWNSIVPSTWHQNGVVCTGSVTPFSLWHKQSSRTRQNSIASGNYCSSCFLFLAVKCVCIIIYFVSF